MEVFRESGVRASELAGKWGAALCPIKSLRRWLLSCGWLVYFWLDTQLSCSTDDCLLFACATRDIVA